MRKLLLVLVVGAACWTGYTRYQHSHRPGSLGFADSAVGTAADTASTSGYSCDGRIYCSQMTSCKEATYFLEHCPGAKMDGDHDGVPCERQWCTGP